METEIEMMTFEVTMEEEAPRPACVEAWVEFAAPVALVAAVQAHRPGVMLEEEIGRLLEEEASR